MVAQGTGGHRAPCAYLSRIDCENLYVHGEKQITDFHADELCIGSSQ